MAVRAIKAVEALLLAALACAALPTAWSYDPDDAGLTTILPPAGQFEAFYPRQAFGQPSGSARSPHAHGSYYSHRHAALVDAPNAAAYGFRFECCRDMVHAPTSEAWLLVKKCTRLLQV